MYKPVTNIFGILLTGSMIMLFLSSFNMDIFSNAMALKMNPYTNNEEDYLQRYERFYKDDSFREAYYNYHKQHHQQEQQQSEEYQKVTNSYYKKGYTDTDNNSYNRNYDNYDYNSYYFGKPYYDSLKTEGTFFVSDAGQAHGGFEFTSEYKTEFDVEDGRGTLTITRITGLSDPLEKHIYNIADLKIKENNKIITMNIDNHPVELIFIMNDEIWNHQFDNNYIASWGGFAPENEIKGMISPIIFPGLPDFWYVELRIPAATY